MSPLKSAIQEGMQFYICSFVDSKHGLWRKEEREGVRRYEQFPPWTGKAKQNSPEVICHMCHHNVRCLQSTVKICYNSQRS